jgi:hypothetical protein
MAEDPTELDQRRSPIAQAATETRRRTVEIRADQAKLLDRKLELERHLFASSSTDWGAAADKARYLLGILALTPTGEDPRIQTMISDVLADFDRLAGQTHPVAHNDPG